MARQPKKPLEQVVADLGRYPLDAYLFVQECISAASAEAHGPLSPEEAELAQWMTQNDVDLDELRRRCSAADLPARIVELLGLIGGPDRMNRHVTGQQLCWAVRDTALKRWGLMARSVLARWNITRTEDVGAIIFALVENDWLQKQPTDSISDFDHVFCFAEAFDEAYRINAQ